AWQVDALYFFILAVTLVFGIGCAVVIFFFAVKYREKEKFGRGADIHGSMVLEVTWTIIPFVIAMVIFIFGAFVFYNLYRAPADTMDVYVVGKQWMWKFQHGTGQREINELHVPAGRKIKLIMTTEDVIHDVFIPDFRTKADVVPGRYTTLWFEATKPGKYHLYCAEYCGLNHSGMRGSIIVMPQNEFDNWLSGNASGQTPVQAGKDLFENKLGCASCHAGGANQRGAKLEGLFGSDVKLVGGQTVKATDEYIRNSIINPSAQVVEGYQPIMPTFKGQVTEEQLVSLVAYIKSLGGVPGATSTTTTAPAASSSPMTNNAANTGNSTNTANAQGSNPNTPKNQPEPTNRNK
ncbi:MAG TPA: cytochrome c oxidase subunit II, partial [Pyrinomonadaceae bacterium]|nr:cytochrome c oxidase subunit II [Pyrinomonadaceae bacterium]